MTNEIATYKPSAMALALKSERLIDLPENIAKSKLMDIVSKTEFELGYKSSDAKQMAMTCNLLLEEIKTEFKAIRIDELPIAFKKGARGEYGEFFGLSVVTFNKWLNGYQVSEQRREALKSIRDAEPLTVKHPSKAEALKMFLEMWVRRYTEYKKSGVIKFDTPFRDYRILWENGLINHDQSEREMFIEQAKFEFTKDFEKNRKGFALTNKVIYFKNKSIVERIDGEDLTVDDEPEIINLACELAIKDYFATCNDFEAKVNKVINP